MSDTSISSAPRPAAAAGTDAVAGTAAPAAVRPRLSLRFRLTSGFLICFLSALSITLISLSLILTLQTKLHFLEVADTFLLELQQARRFEKNYFLYGTNLNDALAHVHTAQQLLRVNADRLTDVVGAAQVRGLQQEVQHYAQLLEASVGPVPVQPEGGQLSRQAGEAELRRHGANLLSLSLQLVQQERRSVAKMLALARQVPISFLVFLFVVMAFLTHKLSRQILGPLSRLKQFTQRIARGDYTPLTPALVYQDEFYDLTQAMNFMLAELQRRQEILMQTQKLRALGTLTAGIAHELNNPINNITLTAYGLRDNDPSLSAADKAAMLQEVIDESDRLRGIVSNLLDYARESEVLREPLDMGQLLQETLLLVGKQIKLAGVHLHLDMPPTLPQVQGDRRQLRQVLLNILVNALDAIPSPGHIHITVRQESPGIVAVAIQDDGPGIPPTILPYIFDPFFTTKPAGRGTGLGLAVSQGIVARHGGRIRVASEPGQGATFTVLLPVDLGEPQVSASKSLY